MSSYSRAHHGVPAILCLSLLSLCVSGAMDVRNGCRLLKIETDADTAVGVSSLSVSANSTYGDAHLTTQLGVCLHHYCYDRVSATADLCADWCDVLTLQ
jgi:hypothetical protein